MGLCLEGTHKSQYEETKRSLVNPYYKKIKKSIKIIWEIDLFAGAKVFFNEASSWESRTFPSLFGGLIYKNYFEILVFFF